MYRTIEEVKNESSDASWQQHIARVEKWASELLRDCSLVSERLISSMVRRRSD
ncbi:MAG TPA: hypothetical protein VF290_08320 [Pyrinomonadaceae bacterium]